jgi:hypothetical protein
MDVNKIEYQCFFCGDGIQSGGLDVCALVLIVRWDQDSAVQRDQQFFCHATCFRKHAHDSVPLYSLDVEGAEEGRGQGHL